MIQIIFQDDLTVAISNSTFLVYNVHIKLEIIQQLISYSFLLIFHNYIICVFKCDIYIINVE
jgi:hypothetical protein